MTVKMPTRHRGEKAGSRTRNKSLIQRCCRGFLVLAAGGAAGSLLVAIAFIPLIYGVDGDSVSQLVLKAATVVIPAASATTTTTTTATTSIPESLRPPLFVAVHSAAMGDKYLLRRALWRAYCGPSLKSQGIPYRFFVGLPSKDKRDPDQLLPGQKATPDEQNASKQLLAEYQTYGDLILTPNRDVYRDKSEKVVGWMRYFVEHGERYVQKVDDEYCPNVKEVLQMLRQHDIERKESELYGGGYRFRGGEYKAKMRGGDGTVSPFLSGHTFGVSRNLARYIAEADAVHSLLYAIYGTSSDDANVGKWVHHAMRFANMSVDLRVGKNLTWALPTDWPGKAKAKTTKPSKAAPPRSSATKSLTQSAATKVSKIGRVKVAQNASGSKSTPAGVVPPANLAPAIAVQQSASAKKVPATASAVQVAKTSGA